MTANALRMLGVLLTLALTACGATSHTRMADPSTLLAEREEWRGERTGPVALRMHIEALVDTRADASKAESALIVHLAVTSFGDPAPIPITLPVPDNARAGPTQLRFVTPTAGAPSTAYVDAPLSVTFTPGAFDSDQQLAHFTLPAPPAGGIVEAILRFDVPGTLTSDARYLGLDIPLGELLLRYDLATDTVGSFQTTLPNARPVVTEKDGRRLIALLATNLAPVSLRDAPSARYVTVSASPKGFNQRWTTDWASATDAYRSELIERGATLSNNYAVPYRPVGTGLAQALDAYTWVRARPMRAPPNDLTWRGARMLPDVIAKNDLTAVERTQLMHWILREAGIAHAFVVARSASRAPLDPAFPAPGLFDAALIYVSALSLVLDPACDACAPGEVRPSLRGGQGLILPIAPGTKSAPLLQL